MPVACAWAERQEAIILRTGVPLSPEQIMDAKQIGIQAPERIRVRALDRIPSPLNPVLRWAGRKLGFISDSTIGMTLRYGIMIHRDHWGDRRLVVHELAHTAQYERLGGFRPFLEAYLRECLEPPGYPFGDLEQEADRVTNDLCG
jgi:hypothetical protein